jgi:hypothetical protein
MSDRLWEKIYLPSLSGAVFNNEGFCSNAGFNSFTVPDTGAYFHKYCMNSIMAKYGARGLELTISLAALTLSTAPSWSNEM